MTIYTYLTSYAHCSQEFSSLTLVLTHTHSQIVGTFPDGRSSSSSSVLLSFIRVHFLQPTNFSFLMVLILLLAERTINPTFKIKSYNIPNLGREGDNCIK
jgi:hypothetical protein